MLSDWLTSCPGEVSHSSSQPMLFVWILIESEALTSTLKSRYGSDALQKLLMISSCK